MSETLEPLNPGVEGLHRAEHEDFLSFGLKSDILKLQFAEEVLNIPR